VKTKLFPCSCGHNIVQTGVWLRAFRRRLRIRDRKWNTLKIWDRIHIERETLTSTTDHMSNWSNVSVYRRSLSCYSRGGGSTAIYFVHSLWVIVQFFAPTHNTGYPALFWDYSPLLLLVFFAIAIAHSDSPSPTQRLSPSNSSSNRVYICHRMIRTSMDETVPHPYPIQIYPIRWYPPAKIRSVHGFGTISNQNS